MAPRKTELECQWQTLSLKEPIFLRQMLIHPHPINRVTTVSDHQPARRYFLWELLEIQIYFVCCFFFNMFYRAELFQLKWLYSSRQGNPHSHTHTHTRTHTNNAVHVYLYSRTFVSCEQDDEYILKLNNCSVKKTSGWGWGASLTHIGWVKNYKYLFWIYQMEDLRELYSHQEKYPVTWL